ncbi:hypothetical protein KL946_004667 [Ogataea haglerorum]|uniref:Phosphatidic acid phosphatase type 2/haloperoxidase domain-containing protein n=1 Tax=Ogataea haglerorum TaxID=1937702 RepID=A0ABQ7RAM9_9ASCO|nr:hypothetical protein KL946_004667 [Ogataea haglerorum]
MLTDDLTSTSKYDAGLQSEAYYRTRMSAFQFKLRSKLLRLVQRETPLLSKIQKTCYTDWLDIYFTYSANLGSHTFYVLCLPLPVWFGFTYRDLVYVLGLGIFFTGAVKDYLCLPRPRCPPLVRKTMSHYTSQEYGCPSSHSANASAVFSLFSYYILANFDSYTVTTATLLMLALFLYFASMVFGRIYCGMHGIVDVMVGILIGTSTVILRLITKTNWDSFLTSNSVLAPIIAVGVYYALLYFHPLPIDHCPCFEDTVAFIGVLMGLDMGFWLLANSSYKAADMEYHGSCKYSLEQLGYIKTALRLALGISILALWKTLAKPLLTRMFKPIHSRVFASHATKLRNPSDCAALRPRYELPLLVRLGVYSGIAFIAIWMDAIYKYVGLALD